MIELKSSVSRSLARLRGARWVPILALAGIVVVGIGLRLYALYSRSIWFDEAVSWRTIQFPLPELIERTARDVHPPFYYIVLKAWTAVFGESLVALRSMSLVFVALAMVGLYLWACEAFGTREGDSPIFAAKHALSQCLPMTAAKIGTVPADAQHAAGDRGRWIGLVSVALFAVSLYQVRLAWEVRMYALGTALVAFSSWLLFRALRAGARNTATFAERKATLSWKPWAAYAVVSILFLYTHYFALFSVAAQAIFVAGFYVVAARGTHHAKGSLGNNLVNSAQPTTKDTKGTKDTAPSCPSCSSWFRFRIRSSYFYALGAYAAIAAAWAPWLPVFLKQRHQVVEQWWTEPFSLHAVLRACYEMFMDAKVNGFNESCAAAAACLCALAVLAVLYKARAGEWYVFCMAALPFLMACAASLVSRNVLVPRFLAFVQPFVLVSLAVLLRRIPDPTLRAGGAVFLLVTGIGVHLDFVESLQIEKRPGARAAAAYIDANREAGEPVIVCSGLLYLPVLFHARDREGWRVYAEQELLHHQGGPFILPEEKVNAKGIEAIRARRAWLVTSYGAWAQRDVHIPSSWRKVSEKPFPEVNPVWSDFVVELYEIGEH